MSYNEDFKWENNPVVEEHYLKRELYQLIKKDSNIFEFLQAGSLDGIWYWDIENNENEWLSPRFWETLGYDPKAKRHLASEWQDIINQDDLKIAISNFTKHCADPNHSYDQIVRYRHKNGSTVWIRCRGIVIRNCKGKPIRMLGAHTDLTLFYKLKERSDLSDHAVMSASCGIIITDYRQKDNPIIFANPYFEKLTGYKESEVLGKNCRFLQGKETKQKSLTTVRNSIKKGKNCTVVVRNYRKDGSLFYNELILSPIRDDLGNVTHFIGIQKDITVQVELEQKLKIQNESLEESIQKRTKELKESESSLKKQKKELEEKNITLKELLAQIEIERQQLKDDIMSNVENLVLPSIEKIRLKAGSKKQIDQHRQTIMDLTSSFGRRITNKKIKLTPREIEVCNMVKNGLTNKEIANLLNIAVHTIERHRRMSRKKLGLANKDINLNTYLNSL